MVGLAYHSVSALGLSTGTLTGRSMIKRVTRLSLLKEILCKIAAVFSLLRHQESQEYFSKVRRTYVD